MGYDATGWITVVSTEEALALMALQAPTLAERTNAANLGSGPLSEKIGVATGLALSEETTLPNGGVEWMFDYQGRWLEQVVGDGLRWMAECGAIVRGEFLGEDGYHWLYRTENGVCSEIGLTNVPYIAKTTLDKMRAWVSVNGLSEVPDDLASILGRLEEDLRWLE